MNWDALSAIAEFVAAVLVLPTLLYLAFQFRQNTLAVKSATYQAVNDSMTKNLEDLTKVEPLVPLIIKAQADYGALTEEERMRYHFLHMTMIRRYEGVYIQRELGLINPSMVEGYERSFLSYLTNSPIAEIWPTIRTGFGMDFANYMDSCLSQKARSIHPGID